MDTEQLFYTQNGYDRADTGPLTTAMEDYLEMICRLTRSGGYTRISALARELHVQPSSASKMAALLRSGGYLTNERYGCLRLTEKGKHFNDDFTTIVREVNEEIEHCFTREEVAQMRELLLRLAESLREATEKEDSE